MFAVTVTFSKCLSDDESLFEYCVQEFLCYLINLQLDHMQWMAFIVEHIRTHFQSQLSITN